MSLAIDNILMSQFAWREWRHKRLERARALLYCTGYRILNCIVRVEFAYATDWDEKVGRMYEYEKRTMYMYSTRTVWTGLNSILYVRAVLYSSKQANRYRMEGVEDGAESALEVCRGQSCTRTGRAPASSHAFAPIRSCNRLQTDIVNLYCTVLLPPFCRNNSISHHMSWRDYKAHNSSTL